MNGPAVVPRMLRRADLTLASHLAAASSHLVHVCATMFLHPQRLLATTVAEEF